MKFYALLCVLIASSLLLTPAVTLLGVHKETAAASPAATEQTEETTTEEIQITEIQER